MRIRTANNHRRRVARHAAIRALDWDIWGGPFGYRAEQRNLVQVRRTQEAFYRLALASVSAGEAAAKAGASFVEMGTIMHEQMLKGRGIGVRPLRRSTVDAITRGTTQILDLKSGYPGPHPVRKP